MKVNVFFFYADTAFPNQSVYQKHCKGMAVKMRRTNRETSKWLKMISLKNLTMWANFTSLHIHHIEKSCAFLPCASSTELLFLPSNDICCKSTGWPRPCLVHPALQVVGGPCHEVHRLYLQPQSDLVVLWLFE